MKYRSKIKTKLVGAFLVIGFFAIGTASVNIIAQRNVAYYTDAVGRSYERVMALLEMKSAATKINNEVIAMLGSEKKYATQFEGDPAADQKYKILASLEILNKWKEEYRKNVDPSQSIGATFIKKIEILENGVVDTTLSYVNLRERGIGGAEAESAYQASILTADDLKRFIESAVTDELRGVQSSIETANASGANAVAVNASISLLMILTAVVLGIFLNAKIILPIRQIRNTAVSIAGGNFSKRVVVASEDELGELSTTFNSMADSVEKSRVDLEAKITERTQELVKVKSGLEEAVAARTAELENIKRHLEQTVTERTKELTEKIEEVERTNKLMVDRELKMIELKKEIEALRLRQ